MNTRGLAWVLLASVGWLALCLGAALAATLPFHDDFENVPVGWYPNANGWQTWYSGITAYVSDWTAYSGAKSFRLLSRPYWSRCDCVYLDQVPDRLTYQASVYMDPMPARAARVGLGHAAGYQLVPFNYFTIASRDGWVGAVEFTGPPDVPPIWLGEFLVGQWITVRADLDFAVGLGDLWLDEELVAAGVPIQPKECDDPVLGSVVLDRFAVAEDNWPGSGYGVIYVDDVVVCDAPTPTTVQADVDIDPDTLNLRSRGRWVTCHIELEDGYGPLEIDPVSLALNSSVAAELWSIAIDDRDLDGVPELTVKFSRQALAHLLTPGSQEVVLTGLLFDGTPVAGSDVIRVTR